MEDEIARLESVDIKTAWPDEPKFSDWLSEHLDELGIYLWMDIASPEREAPVGGFKADILAKDAESRNVIIENQFGQSNHDHLGKVLTYAANYDAAIIVWISEDLRVEHQQTLDWLNQRTDEKSEFYGVEVKVVRIEDSPVACFFDVVSRPSISRRGRAKDGSPSTSERQERYKQFFSGVLDSLRDEHKLTNAKSPSGYSEHFITARVSGVQYHMHFVQGGGARVAVYLYADAARNKRLYDALQAQKTRLEEAFGDKLTWERLDNSRGSRIAVDLPDKRIRDADETLKQTADWMVNTVVRLSQTVIPIVQEVANEVDHEMAAEASPELLDDGLPGEDDEE